MPSGESAIRVTVAITFLFLIAKNVVVEGNALYKLTLVVFGDIPYTGIFSINKGKCLFKLGSGSYYSVYHLILFFFFNFHKIKSTNPDRFLKDIGFGR